MSLDYVERILAARVYEAARVTPLELAPGLSRRLGNRLWLKREDLQEVFSFKIRGAYNKLVNLPASQLQRGVICASAGNHAQGVALSAAKLGCRAVIVMPTTTPQVKVEAVRSHGGASVEVLLHGQSYTDAHDHAAGLERERGLSFVHPFDDPDVIAGQGTVGMEILQQHPAPIDAVFVAIGGGLVAGIGAFLKARRPGTRVVGVQMADSDAMARSLVAGRRVTLPQVGLFSDGTAVRLVGRETFRLAREVVDEIILVDADAVCAAIRDVFLDTRAVLEPAGALAVAGASDYVQRTALAGEALRGRSLVAVAGGDNIDFDRLGAVAVRSAAVRDGRQARPLAA